MSRVLKLPAPRPPVAGLENLLNGFFPCIPDSLGNLALQVIKLLGERRLSKGQVQYELDPHHFKLGPGMAVTQPLSRTTSAQRLAMDQRKETTRLGCKASCNLVAVSAPITLVEDTACKFEGCLVGVCEHERDSSRSRVSCQHLSHLAQDLPYTGGCLSGPRISEIPV
jgi:hypothetical protein